MSSAYDPLERHWVLLLDRIENGEFTPFIGAEECSAGVRSSSEIAHELAKRYDYPMKEGDEDIARVTQYMSITDEMSVRNNVAMVYKNIDQHSDYLSAEEPHGVLARLPISLYITTNYHSIMTTALKKLHREPRTDWCRRDINVAKNESALFDSSYIRSVANPCVFHLFGSVNEPASLVITEDDYLDFLVRTSEERELIPYLLKDAVASNALLFIGYHPRDFEFRVLLRLSPAATQALQGLSPVRLDRHRHEGHREAGHGTRPARIPGRILQKFTYPCTLEISS